MLKKIKYPIALGMLQPAPLPGSYRHKDQSLESITAEVLKEAEMLIEFGFDGFILQNMNDMPIKHHSKPEAIAYMTSIGLQLKQRFPNAILGILLNWDGVASVAVANAVGADFVRVEHLYTGVNVTSAGLLEGQCVEVAEIRKRTNSEIPVFADLFEVHGVPLGAKPVKDAAWEIINEAFAQGVFLAGKTPEESIVLSKEARKGIGNAPLFLGGGATGDNVRELLKYYDGVSVATWIKNGDMKNPIDPELAKIFIAEVNKARENR